VWVEVDPEDVPRIEEAAAALGVERPVHDGGLRFEGGHCVFLAEDMRCEIHRRFGGTTKPARCQQFPFVAVRAEDSLRAGIDPACGTAWQTWRDGPVVEVGEVVLRARPLHPDLRAAEKALVAATGAPDATVAGLLHLLCTGAPGGPRLPPGFAGRWIERLQAADLAGLLADPQNGRALRLALGAFPDAIAALDALALPSWPVLDAAQDAWAVEATRRMVFLRLASLIPTPLGVALQSLGGAVACAWVDPTPERFGPAFAGWLRLVRLRALWQKLTPDADSMRWLATGR